jgi:isoleucyl-tRNA synthetase
VLLDGKYADEMTDVVPLIKEELNVKEVVFAKDLSEFMAFSLKPNFRKAGPLLGKKIKAFGKFLAELDAADIAPRLESGETVSVDFEG